MLQKFYDIKTNTEGYVDTTAGDVIQKDLDEEARFKKLLWAIRYIVKIAGFTIENRIILTDNTTGRTWK